MKKTFLCQLLLSVIMFLVAASLFSSADAAIEHKVKKGDNFYTIAKKYHVSLADLKKANAASARDIKPGDKVIIPSEKKEARKTSKRFASSAEHVSGRKSPKELVVEDKAPEPAKTSSKDIYHVVKKGDTLSSISHKYSLNLSELRDLNGLKKAAKLKNGQKLLVKAGGPKTYTVRKGDTIQSIARKYKMDGDELMEINEMESPSLKVGQKLFLEISQPSVTEPQGNEVIARQLEEELKSVSKSEEYSEKSLPEKLSVFAHKLLNIPYKFGGNSILGIDCSAYVKKVYGFMGIELPRTAREQFNEGEPIVKEDLSIGDLVFFRTYASFPSHVGIYLGNNLFIHASSRGKKVKVDNLDAPYYEKRFIGAKRLLSDESKLADPQS
jgi:peptidoglycan DL-endopeptidase LytE